MDTFRKVHGGLLIGLLFVTLAWTGCSDALLDSGLEESDMEESASAQQPTKLRHAELLDQAMRVTSSFSGEGHRLASSSSDTTVGLIISFSNPSFDPTKLYRRYKLFRRYEYKNVFSGIAVELPLPELGSLLSHLDWLPGIAWVEPDVLIHHEKSPLQLLSAESARTPWGIERIGAPAYHAEHKAASNVDLYILDSGTRSDDLAVASQVDVTDSVTGLDNEGHGYHVAGTAASLDNDRYVIGVAAGVVVHSVKVLNDEGGTPMSQVIAGVDHLVGQRRAHPERPMVANVSLGANMGTSTYNALDRAVQAAIEAGITVVVAAGNDGIDASLVSPAHVTEAITVGAYDQHDRFASFSNYGSGIDILAPGVEVLSLTFNEHGTTSIGVMSGTSMAAPHVAGAAALYLSQHPAAMPAEVRNALVHSGQSVIRGVPANTTSTTVFVGEAFTYEREVAESTEIKEDSETGILRPLLKRLRGLF